MPVHTATSLPSGTTPISWTVTTNIPVFWTSGVERDVDLT